MHERLLCGFTPLDLRFFLHSALASCMVLVALPSSATDSQPVPADGLAYPVSNFVLEYAEPRDGQPPTAELEALEVPLLDTREGFVAPREGLKSTDVSIEALKRRNPREFYGSAIRSIGAAIVEEFKRRGIVGVLVTPAPQDIDPRSNRDLRPTARADLRLVVYTGHLVDARTVAIGDRFPEGADGEGVDHPAHARIRENSPIGPGDLLDKAALDRYLARLNRHPRRNVDLTLTSADEAGGVFLDFLVAESQPWSVYAQGSNTGTKTTNKWRERFGYTNTQLSGRDDVLQFDVITAGDSSLNAVFASYELPLLAKTAEPAAGAPLLLRVDGVFSDYDASEVGVQDARFQGTTWEGGVQVIQNVLESPDYDFFLDFFMGAKFQHVRVDNEPVAGFRDKNTAQFAFFEPGFRAQHQGEWSNFSADVRGVFNLSSVAGTKASDLVNGQLGRNFVDSANIQLLRWRWDFSLFLEPLLNPKGYLDASTPASSTLAHELVLSNWGQYSGERLIPQHERVAGGLNTVRGYPQAIVAGDTVIVTRAEYRLHLPRLLPIDPQPLKLPWLGDFQLFRPQVYGSPDWDLVLRGFVDAAQVRIVDRQVGESNSNLLGAGVGLELTFRRNLVLRADWGNARKGLSTPDEDIGVGNNEFYFSFTAIY